MLKHLGALVAGSAALFAAMAFDQPAERSRGSVLLFLSTDCPKAMQYSPRLVALEQQFEPKGFTFTAYFPNALETRGGATAYAAERGYKFEVQLDLGAQVASKYGVRFTPEVVVLDSRGKVAYQGAIDDNSDASLVKHSYLADALAALEADRSPTIPKTQPFGCYLMPSEAAPTPAAVNYAEHVAPILYKNCTECHRPGEVAPFSLIGYENARKWSKNIVAVTEAKRMPPWKAVHGYGEFAEEKVLSETELETLRRWADNGAPRGDATKEPKTPAYPVGWHLGEPNVVLTPQVPFKLEADGADVYRNFVFKTNFAEPRYVNAIDVKPGNARVVHHVIAFVDAGNSAAKLEAKNTDGQAGYTSFGGPGFLPDTSFGGWAPGFRSYRSPEGTGFLLKPGASVVLQIHYHKTGKPELDQTKLGLYFTEKPAEKVLEIAWLANPTLRIPAGEASHKVGYNFTIPNDVTMYGVLPHMHLLGRSMKAEIVFPDGTKRPMIHVDDWDFRWQIGYRFKEPIEVPKGSKIVVEALYDNSVSNPNQPNSPPKDVRWGEQTSDEMFLLVIPYTKR